jgi:diguanylate cyclase (GGDEF)-like protein
VTPPAVTSTALSTQRLAEFLAVVSAAPDPDSAFQVAAERAARALEAEVAVVLEPAGVITSVGFAFGRVPVADLAEVLAGRPTLAVPGAGTCQAVVAPLGGTTDRHLLVARSGGDGFTVDEVSLVRGMARVLELTVAKLHTYQAERRQAAENARLVRSLRERQRLLEQLSTIQRAITRRAPLQSILDSITAGAQELLRDEVAVLRMIDPDEPGMVLMVSHTGLPEELAKRIWRVRVGDAGAGGLAIQRDTLAVLDDYPRAPESMPEAATASIQSAMAAPVHEHHRVVGSLVVASYRPGRVYSQADREMLQVFAEQVSLAVTDAKTQEAMHQAFHDSLTGLASRALFLDQLDHALARTAQEGGRLAVLFVDLDRFKNINDSLGHSAGDALLMGVADRLRGCLGPRDTAARLGGDEFAVVVRDGSAPEQVVGMAKRIIGELRAPFHLHGHETFIDASVGIAWGTDRDQDAQSLMRDAVLAMYQAKKNGKGRYEVFHPALRADFLRSLELEARLRGAVERDELELHYQPIVRLADRAVVGVEALVRWRDPHQGLVAPREFVPLAEETGLIVPIDRWVLREACRQGAEWNRQRAADPVDPADPAGGALTVSVNVSARQLQQADLPTLVSDDLAATGLDPACLVLEITESTLLADTEATIDRLRQLRALGVRVAIDDFGTGYSSLAYLRRFPVDIIKIDRSFLEGPGAEAWALARTIVELGRILRLTTVAEGVETAVQADELRAAGCELAQGNHFARPRAAACLGDLIPPRDAVMPAAG